jgi:hypothetical protein
MQAHARQQTQVGRTGLLGAAKNGAIFGGMRRRHGSQAAEPPRALEPMGEDAVQHSTISFYTLSLLLTGAARSYDRILRANC